MNTLQIIPSLKSFDLIIDDIASDKSISHRSVIFSMLCEGECTIDNFLLGEDTLNTLEIIKSIGAKVDIQNSSVKITPPKILKEPQNVLDCGNSGTAIRLLCGFFASQKDKLFILNGDSSIRSRPMKRIIEPLNNNKANIISRDGNTKAPIVVSGVQASGFNYTMTVSSAQVKSALILYALNASKPSIINEVDLSRNHTEIMLQKMGADIQTEINNNAQTIKINPLKNKLKPFSIEVPSDPSSGFFFAIAVFLIKNSSITLRNVLLNDTRIEAYKILQKMGGDITFVNKVEKFELVGDIVIKHSALKAVEVSENIAWLIDEVPALAIAFCIADGTSVIKNATELRHKESDRIKAIVDNLKLCNIDVLENEDGFSIVGQSIDNIIKSYDKIKLVDIDSFKDHRIAMSFAIFGLIKGINVIDIDCINTSFPNFISILNKIKG